ncbi:hypothetical protein ACFQ1S_21615 [Kibdelosporangium lantanae]|uniref:Uncharacterized protein n=1 Tax=Kibdelosporangium lantanae TaxID=1497396 RepID=A0ABW3ME15_9PSEU
MPVRAEHAGYVKAVVRDLNSLGIRIDGLRIFTTVPAGPSPAPGEPVPVRAASMFVPASPRWPWFEPLDIFAGVQWDEEHGWIVEKVFELFGGRGPDRGSRCYGLDLDVVPDPTEVALHIEALLTTSNAYRFNESQPRCRRSADHEPSLERALAAHLPA